MHVQFVLGIPDALPADRQVLDFELAQLESVLPGATWTAAGIGRHQLDRQRVGARAGRSLPHRPRGQRAVRQDRLAASNAELVARVAELYGEVRPLGGHAGRSAADSGVARRLIRSERAKGG